MTSYSYLGPAGTFTEAALAQVPEARGAIWRAVHNVPEALDDVVSGRSVGAVIAIENSIDGGVSVAQDLLATIPGVRITGEYLVPIDFVLVARPGVRLEQVHVIAAHPVAYAQCQGWLARNLPSHTHVPASSNVAAAAELPPLPLVEADTDRGTVVGRLNAATGRGVSGAGSPGSTDTVGNGADAAIAPPTITEHHSVEVLARGIIDNPNAVTRFVLVKRTRRIPASTGADKTSVVVELPAERAGTLLELLQQFATRGVNMNLIQSRPIGDALGRYRFIIDLEGHLHDERVADALMGVHRFSPSVTFLGSYPRADSQRVTVDPRYRNEVFARARDWLRGLEEIS